MKQGKYDIIMMKTAILWLELSYCTRRKVSAVIAKDNAVITNGYNGTISGQNNDCEDICDVCKGDGRPDKTKPYDDQYNSCSKCGGNGKVTNKFTLHAEENAIARAAKKGLSLAGSTMYVTTSPCANCSKLIAQAGISRVVYLDSYKDQDSIGFLKSVGVKVEKFDSSKLKE